MYGKCHPHSNHSFSNKTLKLKIDPNQEKSNEEFSIKII